MDKTPNNPKFQTRDEWIAEYVDNSDTKYRHPESGQQNIAPPLTTNLFRFVGHRTTCMGSVVLEFESINSNLVAVCFFNASLKSTRGNNYPAGKHGQFNPPKNGKFRRFWMNAVGEAPLRWSRVHKSMRSKLSELVFTGQTTQSRDRNGQTFTKLTEVLIYE